MNETVKALTVVTCHYGDVYWVNQLLNYFQINCYEFIDTIYVIDNSGNFEVPNLNIGIDVKRIEFLKLPPGSPQHANSLQAFLNSFQIETPKLLIVDSDVVFLNNDWIDKFMWDSEHEAHLAIQEGSRYLTHPCFNLISSQRIKFIDYTEGMSEFGFDTGRLIGLQLARNRVSVKKIYPQRYYSNSFGYSYSNESFVHATSGSVRLMPSRRKFFVEFKIYFLKWLTRGRHKLVRKLPLIFLLFLSLLSYCYNNVRKFYSKFIRG